VNTYNSPTGGFITRKEATVSKFDFLQDYINGLSDTKRGGYILKPGKSESEIRQLEVEVGITIPTELEEFYAFSYGARLNEYKILTVSEIIEQLYELRQTYGDAWKESVFPFAYLMGVGDLIAFDLEKLNADGMSIVDCFHELSPGQWNVICFGLRTWLERMTSSDFQPFWLQ
jgi:hypothetical protein